MTATLPVAAPLSDRELAWLSAQREAARRLVETYTGRRCLGPPTVAQIHKTYDAWLAQLRDPPKRRLFKKQADPAKPRDVAIALGVALGDQLAGRTGLEWTIVNGQRTGLGLHAPGGTGTFRNITTYPVRLMAKRTRSSASDWIDGAFATLTTDIRTMLGMETGQEQ